MAQIKLFRRSENSIRFVAGRRNLTDDQRAIVWNEIREQRSKIEKVERAVKASAVSQGLQAKTDLKPKEPKEPTRTSVAKEAKLPENKLKQAQKLKKHQPELYKKVLNGEVTLRNTSKLTKKTTGRKVRAVRLRRLGESSTFALW
jgi:hypothetical protein